MLLVVSRFELLSDEQWALIEDLLPARTGKPGRPFSDARAMVEGIIYRYRCGLAWRDVPAVFGPWQTIWTWHRRLARGGHLGCGAAAAPGLRGRGGVDRLVGLGRLHHRAGASARHDHHPPQGAGSNYTKPGIEPLDHAISRSRGGWTTKIHRVVDGNGRALVTLLTPGQAGDSPMFEPLMAHLQVPRLRGGRARTRPDRVRGDKAYSSRAIHTYLRRRKIQAVIPEPADQARHRKRRGSRGGRPPAFHAHDYRGRNVIERDFNQLK
ncbi:IS5 family transposase [Amycolatopsis tucumanensis]